ncbi:MAG: DUF4189 domain-containing protein [Neisseria sp.]|uniref:DUF4189 domain-containing protein n=1 Tax=Neisseria sp. TaxID=192066 RepID=UPI0026DC23A2|nr:DUF4189 domain-containing protein [Neisseria sp.]MDO4640689.1 DUF4189 domain-containing protein [Neisseria sp.]
MKRFIPILLLGFSAPVTLACGSVSDPHCMEPVLHDPNSPHYLGNEGSNYQQPSKKVILIKKPDAWGGVSLNETTSTLYNTVEQPSPKATRKKLLEICKEESRKANVKEACSVTLVFSNGWGTVAAGETQNGNFSFSASGATKEEAEANAIAGCMKYGAKNKVRSCKIIVPTFSSLPK